MADKTFRLPLGHLKPDRVHVTARFVGNTTSTGTVPTTDNPYITSITRTGTGVHTVVWKLKFPGTVDDPKVTTIGTTAGLQGRFTALDAAAGTATVITEVAGTATDAATTDTVYLSFWVRNSASNR